MDETHIARLELDVFAGSHTRSGSLDRQREEVSMFAFRMYKAKSRGKEQYATSSTAGQRERSTVCSMRPGCGQTIRHALHHSAISFFPLCAASAMIRADR